MGPPREHGGMWSLACTHYDAKRALQWGRRVNTAECFWEAFDRELIEIGFNGAAA